jgi:predicted metal-dependent peptidase
MTTPTYDLKQLQSLLERVKIALMSNPEVTFFTVIALNLKFIWDEECETAWTNGFEMGFNPRFFLSMSEEERLGVYIHEASHVAYDHMGRLLGRIMSIWNQAADHVINLYLLQRGFKLPSFRLADPRFTGMSTEQVYDILLTEQDTLPKNPMEDIRESVDKTPQETQKHVQDLIVRAAVQAKMTHESGNIPGEVEMFIKKLLNPKLPWQTLLQREIHELIKTGYSWMRPNRRFFPTYHLPSRSVQGPTRATFYIDISGSVAQYQFDIFISEIVGAIKQFNLKEVRIVQFDTHIHHDDTVKSLKELSRVKFHGRGGTHIECILQHMEKTKPELAMVFTDGGFFWPRQTFKQRILWLINDNPEWKPLFGRSIHFDTHKRK